MKNRLLAFALVVPLLFAASFAYAGDPIVNKLQDISVTIRAGNGQGSGVLFNREVDGKVVTYVWTAAHVIDELRQTRQVVVNGSSKTVVEFKDAEIVREFREDGRRIGEIKLDARVLRYSDADRGEDLAILEVRKRNFVGVEQGATFYLDSEIPTLGTELYHVGSLKGQFGANSLTTGVVAQIGRVLDLAASGTVFDQTTVTAFPGSSGGGVFLKEDGRYVGMLVRGAGEQFNFIVPARRMHSWASAAGVLWAMDPNVPVPADLSKLPVEDVGVTFDK